ncbi:MAG: hemolysin family protein [Elusimicrobiota bacterium]|jgi:CBS domain containing-hemolysin-like protein|nr:hemolysin family protein [Elusimicrobiota bacterium]
MFIFSYITILFCLIVLSAWISAAEIGITSLSKYKVKKLIAQKPAISSSLILWLKSPYYLLTVILLINVVSDMLTSFLSTSFLVSVFSTINRHIIEFAAWACSSFVLLIFGEIIPKFYARANPEKITIFSVPILSNIWKILKPVLYPMIKIIELVSPKTSQTQSYELNKEEIDNILSEIDSNGEIDNETSGMLKRTLNFENLPVKEIMTPFEKVESVDSSLEDECFLDIAIETARSRIPVYVNSKDNIIGYIHIKDILKLCQETKGHFIRSMIKKPHYVDENKKTSELLKEFRSGKTHIAFIKNKSGNIVGMLTLEDILEKLVGDIIDEYELQKLK